MGARITQLAPALVNRDGHGIGEVKAATAWAHGYHHAVVFRCELPDARRQPSSFRSEHQGVAVAKPALPGSLVVLGGEGEESLGVFCFKKSIKVGMNRYRRQISVIQTSTAKLGLLQCKAERFNEMKRTARIGTQSDDVACIRWYLRFVQNDVKQHRSLFELIQTLFSPPASLVHHKRVCQVVPLLCQASFQTKGQQGSTA